MCCKIILSFCILLSLGNSLYYGRYRPQFLRDIGQRQYPLDPQAFGMLPPMPLAQQPQQPLPMGPQPYNMGPQPQQTQQVPETACSGCVININCGGRECLPTTTQQPTQPTWTVATPATVAPGTAPQQPGGGCRVCACYMPPPCQICQPCQ